MQHLSTFSDFMERRGTVIIASTHTAHFWLAGVRWGMMRPKHLIVTSLIWLAERDRWVCYTLCRPRPCFFFQWRGVIACFSSHVFLICGGPMTIQCFDFFQTSTPSKAFFYIWLRCLTHFLQFRQPQSLTWLRHQSYGWHSNSKIIFTGNDLLFWN